MESLVSNFKLVFDILVKNWKIFKRIERCEYWSNCDVLAIYQWIRLDKLYKQMGRFSKFQIRFRINGLKSVRLYHDLQTNSWASFLS